MFWNGRINRKQVLQLNLISLQAQHPWWRMDRGEEVKAGHNWKEKPLTAEVNLGEHEMERRHLFCFL